ncbi:MAG: IS1634 family transposase [Bacilli bacterium]|nr:IS1634 family transposase [Bacilli bacterium]
MFVKQNKTHKGILLTYTIGYREDGKVKHKNVETLGYLDDLKKVYDDPIKHFKDLAKQKSNDEINELTIKNLNTKTIDENSVTKNLGYFIIKKIYKELGISNLLKEKQKNLKIDFKLDDVLSMLVNMRILKPGSKKDAYDNSNILFDKIDFSLDDVYKCLTYLNPLQQEIQKTIWENTKDKYNRDTSKTYYDCTNYYFEIEYNDEDIFERDEKGEVILDKDGLPIIKQKGSRKRGPEKNRRPDPIIEMGLLMDASCIPLSYNLFPGNESEKLSLVPQFNKIKNDFNLGRTIVVADRGLNTSDNIIKIAGTSLEDALKHNGYVYGQSVRGADDEFKSWVLSGDYRTDIIKDDDGNEIVFKHKSRIYPKKMYVTRDDKGKTKTGNKKREYILVDQKQMVYYSQKYADKQKRDREMIIKKANDLISHPELYTRATSYGVAGYVNNLKFVKGTGEVADASNISLNIERIKEEEKYDGYYSIVTSEENLTDIEIRNIYRGLSKIEETFKVTKSGLEARPVWVSRADHIESHFLTCFIALVIIRLLEIKLNNKYSFKKIIETIRNYTSNHVEHNVYLQGFRNDVIKDIENVFSIDLSKKFLTLSQIKNFF